MRLGCRTQAASGDAAAEPPRSRRTRAVHSTIRRQLPFVRTLSAFRGKNDAEQHAFVRAYLSGSADMSATIRRDHIVDPVIGNRRPFAVYLDFADRCSRASNGFPAAMIRRSACHRESCGAAAIEFPAE